MKFGMQNNIDRVCRRLRAFLYGLYPNRAMLLIPSKRPIDIIIPLVEKDLDIFPLCLESIRHNVLNVIKNIYIVAPDNARIKEFCSNNGLMFIDENVVLGYSVKDLDYITSSGVDRNGWLFQQYIKLSGNVRTCDDFVTIDSDHILLEPHVFITDDNRYVFYRSCEFHLGYYLINNRLLGKLKIPALSFVAHKMVFNKKHLSELKSKIKDYTGMEWDRAILANLDRNDTSAFSEFEIYASSMPKELYVSVLWNQLQLKRSKLISYDELKKKYVGFLSVTFPEYFT